jgi:hypothetical protein
MRIEYVSKVPRTCRPALEELLYFNPAQANDAESIMRAIEVYGRPQIRESADGLSVGLSGHDAQSLFAVDEECAPPAPVGVAIFTRTGPEEMAIVQVAVDPAYTRHSGRTGGGLGLQLVWQIRRIAARITGVRRIVSFYRQRFVIPVR